jgi:hypothetical protein
MQTQPVLPVGTRIAKGCTFPFKPVAYDKGTCCMPDDVTAAQLAEVGVQYITRNIKNAHSPAPALLWLAYGEAWLCKR